MDPKCPTPSPRTYAPGSPIGRTGLLPHGRRSPGFRKPLRLLKDARENYPAWIEALLLAKKFIHFESYIIHEDEVGRRFAEILTAKSREGVKVRLLYDWVGGFGKTSGRFWKHLRGAGVEVRCFNPPRRDSPLGWITRDHRKMIAVDGRVAFVTGLCVGRRWAGEPQKGSSPGETRAWRSGDRPSSIWNGPLTRSGLLRANPCRPEVPSPDQFHPAEPLPCG